MIARRFRHGGARRRPRHDLARRLLLIALLMGFEAASLQRWTLSRRKWRQLDIVVADDEEAAERRFFDRWTARQRGLDQRSMGGRSRRAAADAQYSGPAVLEAAAAAAGRHHRTVSGTGRIAMSVAIIDYGSGNLHSAAKAFERAARSMEDPQKIMVTRDPEAVYPRRSHRAARRRRLRRLPQGPRCASTACSRR